MNRYRSQFALALLAFASLAAHADVNNCSVATAMDLRGQANVAVAFGGGLGFTYNPRCIRVDVNTIVTFNGSFSGHPHVGGTQVGAVVTPDPTSPFSPLQNTGSSRAVTMTTAGEFGYYCNFHGGSQAMSGAVIVEAAGLPDPVFLDGFE